MAPNENNHQVNNGQNKIPVAVIMVPFAAQGHMNQFLHLTRLISPYNIPIHFVSTTTHTQQAKSRFIGADPLHVHFHEYPVPPSHPPPPSPTTTTGKIPGLFQPSVDASFHLRDPVAKLMSALSPTAERLVVIHDFLASASVQDIVSIPNAEAYTFQGVSAFFAFTFFWEMYGKPPIIEDAVIEYLPPINTSFTPEFVEHIDTCLSYVKIMRGIIYDGFRLLEGKYIDLNTCKEMMGEIKQWALGPLNPVSVSQTKKEANDHRHKCLEWLDEQDPNSVIYVCFGTTVSLVEQQVEELAIGLEKSEQKFIWVLTVADKEVLCKEERGSAELPEGYEERVKGQGMVIRDWAPQLEILGHPSTGGFLSHCGWNSCMESLSFGVPIAAWPMHSDQPRNSMLITKGLKTGIMVRDWALGHEKLVTSLTVEKAVRRLMASKEGEEARRRAAEVGGDLRESVAEGGVTRVELDSFISHITR